MWRRPFAAALVFLIACFRPLLGYSVLSHEAVIDAVWDVKLRGLLLQRFPNATAEQLRQAHGYAYGGAIIQDLGYYPRGNPRFSDLTHYVRTGDFVLALFHDARGLNDWAFALGALSHYISDSDGHRYGTNVAEPLLYPKLRTKFGAVVTYEDDPLAHLKTEFSFDVLQVARGHFAPQTYHDFIGFYVAQDSLGRAFRDTYGLELADLFDDFDDTINSYRSAVSRTVPTATRVAWTLKKDEIKKLYPEQSRKTFIYRVKRSTYRRDWGQPYDPPSKWDRFLAVLLRLVPPIGPLRTLGFKVPTPPAEHLFVQSFDRAAGGYLEKLKQVGDDTLNLEDRNYDVGLPTPLGVYRLKDETEAFWLGQLATKKFATVTPAIRRELLAFYGNPAGQIQAKQKTPQAWKKTLAELQELRNLSQP